MSPPARCRCLRRRSGRRMQGVYTSKPGNEDVSACSWRGRLKTIGKNGVADLVRAYIHVGFEQARSAVDVGGGQTTRRIVVAGVARRRVGADTQRRIDRHKAWIAADEIVVAGR